MSWKINWIKQIHQTIFLFRERSRKINQMKQIHQTIFFPKERADVGKPCVTDLYLQQRRMQKPRGDPTEVSSWWWCVSQLPLATANSSDVEDGCSRNKLTTGTDKDTRDPIRRKQAMKTLAWRVPYLKLHRKVNLEGTSIWTRPFKHARNQTSKWTRPFKQARSHAPVSTCRPWPQ